MNRFRPIDRIVVGLRATVEARVTAHVSETLYDETAGVEDFPRRTRDIVGRLEALEAGFRRLKERQQPTPFRPDLTIHDAWRRHSGVSAVFARYHLPHCDTCPVGLDETLAEAAAGHGFPLKQLLADLDRLLFDTDTSPLDATK